MKGSIAILGGLAALAAAVLFIAGCGSKERTPVAAVNGNAHDANEHEHAKGIKALGDYHARIVVEQGGVLKLYILGKDETKVATIQEQEIQAAVRATDDPESVAIVLKPDRQPGDPRGKTSQFIGTVPENLRGKPLIADVRLVIDDQVYRPTFESVPGTGHAGGGHGMPKGVARGGAGISEEERQLYLAPGGIYTAADVAANGNTVPSVKFKNMSWPHDDDLKPGDKVCPVTMNKADKRCAWIVAGKSYEFCCPPCLDKFVKWAKTQPHKIKEPEAYVYKE